jgi:predicted esterase
MLVAAAIECLVLTSACARSRFSIAPDLASASASGSNQPPRLAPPVTAASTKQAEPETARRLPPLAGADWIEPLPLADGELAYVVPPIGAREPRPLVLAVHGAGDRPEWACGGWRLGTNEYPFVVCPEGLKMDAQRFGWDSPRTIQTRAQAALEAVRTRFGAYVAEGPTVYAGFSQGATLAAQVLLEQRDGFPVVVLAEGGYDLLRNEQFLLRLRERGTARVLIVCGSPACFLTAANVKANLEHAGLESFVAGDPLSGHNLNQRMQDALHPVWLELTNGLPNWSGYAAYLAARSKP